jgi:hypothetical protein
LALGDNVSVSVALLLPGVGSVVPIGTATVAVLLSEPVALAPIVQEAGGIFTSVDGEPGPWHGSALATNGLLHEAALRALSAASGNANR